ncbi:MAG TPA: hypothetical protein QGH10_24175, partial [Armatimonadota bacterium]|nr:hypothetical protein [Armatimonadota bacterium]
MEIEITLKGRKRRVSRERIIEALDGVEPDHEAIYMVDIEGVAFPVRQALCDSLGVDRRGVHSDGAASTLKRLGFDVVRNPVVARRQGTPEEKTAEEGSWAARRSRQEEAGYDELEIGTIHLRWSYLEHWEDLAGTGEHAAEVSLPPHEPGVYEVYRSGQADPIYIGQSADLKRRIMNAMIQGTAIHQAGRKMRENEEPSALRVRWAPTERPAAAEEEL